MAKEIHFYLDCTFPPNLTIGCYDLTKKAIENKREIIHTTSLASIGFDLLDLGYRIFLHRNNKVLECKPRMDGTEREIRKEHNLLKLIMGHVFDDYFNEKPYLDNSEFDWGHNVNHNSEEL